MASAAGSGWPRDEPAARARHRYVPLGAEEAARRRRRHEEYTARRALFLQSYRFSTDGREDEEEEGLRGRLARRMREAVARAVSRARGAARRWCVGAGLAGAWRGWRAPRPHPLLRCFGPSRKYYLHGFA